VVVHMNVEMAGIIAAMNLVALVAGRIVVLAMLVRMSVCHTLQFQAAGR
jgi:hypothetical protein